jgi:amphi-Trp domain-containing protein
MSERTLEFTTRLTREDVAGVMEALVDGLKDGRLKVHKSNDALELDVPRVIDLDVRATVSHERAAFSIEVSWRTNRAENPDTPEGASSTPSAAGTVAPKARRATPAKRKTPTARTAGKVARAVKKP